MCDGEEEVVYEDDEDESTPCRPWSWASLLAEISKPLVGITYGLMAVAQAVASMADGIHGDLVANHNYKIYQAQLRNEMALTLEKL